MDAPPRRLAYRHPVSRRINHWLNVVAVIVLLMTGLNIFGAHPSLYWGAAGNEHDRPVLTIGGSDGHGHAIVAGTTVDTTGLLGWSGGHATAFPSWATIPSFRDLAAARNWHLFMAWVLIVNGIVFWIVSLSNRHVAYDLLPSGDELRPRNLLHDIAEHAKLRFPKGADSNRYHILQKLAYLSLAAVFLPMMIVTGLSLSPGADAVAPWIVDLLGGRQSARTLHFVFMALTVGFIVVHVLAVVLAGFANQMRSMITGRWAYDAGPEPVPMPAARTTLDRAG